MGSRSLTIILKGNEELCRIYRQYDGYPEGHGLELAKIISAREMVNGFTPGAEKTQANGMGCLAALIISSLKGDECGNIYIESPGGEISDWVEYVYTIRQLGGERAPPTIQCTTQTGPFPFNVQGEDAHVFTGSAAAWLVKYGAEAAE